MRRRIAAFFAALLFAVTLPALASAQSQEESGEIEDIVLSDEGDFAVPTPIDTAQGVPVVVTDSVRDALGAQPDETDRDVAEQWASHLVEPLTPTELDLLQSGRSVFITVDSQTLQYLSVADRSRVIEPFTSVLPSVGCSANGVRGCLVGYPPYTSFAAVGRGTALGQWSGIQSIHAPTTTTMEYSVGGTLGTGPRYWGSIRAGNALGFSRPGLTVTGVRM